MAQTNKFAIDKNKNKNFEKSDSARAGQPPKGGSGVPDDTQENGGGNDLDSHGHTRGSGDTFSGPEQDHGSAGGDKPLKK